MTSTHLEQQRAAFALDFVHQERAREGKGRARLRSLIQKAPVMVLQNGLGQTLAFLLADAGGREGPATYLYEGLERWLCRERAIYPEDSGQGGLIDRLVNGDRRRYLRAQQEALALLGWLKKFAEAWLEEEG